MSAGFDVQEAVSTRREASDAHGDALHASPYYAHINGNGVAFFH